MQLKSTIFIGVFNMNLSPYDLRKGNTLYLPLAYSTHHEINSLLLLGSLFWSNLRRETKKSLTSKEFQETLPYSSVVCTLRNEISAEFDFEILALNSKLHSVKLSITEIIAKINSAKFNF